MPVECALSIVVPIFKGKVDIKNCNCYRAVKFLAHEMKVVVGQLEKRLCGIVTVSKMLFGIMSESGTIDAMFILKRLQGKYHAKGRVVYVYLEKAVDKVPRNVIDSAMRKNGYQKFWLDQ